MEHSIAYICGLTFFPLLTTRDTFLGLVQRHSFPQPCTGCRVSTSNLILVFHAISGNFASNISVLLPCTLNTLTHNNARGF